MKLHNIWSKINRRTVRPRASHAPTLGFVLHDLARLLRKRFEQQSAKLRLTSSQWQVLTYVTYKPGIQQSALAGIPEIARERQMPLP